MLKEVAPGVWLDPNKADRILAEWEPDAGQWIPAVSMAHAGVKTRILHPQFRGRNSLAAKQEAHEWIERMLSPTPMLYADINHPPREATPSA